MPGPLRPLVAFLVCCSVALTFVLFGCGDDDSVTGPGRPARSYLGLAANPDSTDPPDSIASAIYTAIATGATMWTFTPLWSELEPDSGEYQVGTLRQSALILNSLGLAVYVNVRVLDTNQRAFPGYLAGVPMGSPRLQARLDALVDTVFASLVGVNLLSVSLGNEVDAYFALNPGELDAWKDLFVRERGRIRGRLPGLPVGCCTISPLENPRAWVGDTLNAYTDLRIYTHYPFLSGSDFTHRAPAGLEADLDAMAAHGPGATLWALQEIGYSSSPVNGSSEAAQADFVRRFRAYMKTSNRSSLQFAQWFLYTDFPQDLVDTLLVYYGASSPGFAAYLKNLGLRRSDGTPKEAWNAWLGEP